MTGAVAGSEMGSFISLLIYTRGAAAEMALARYRVSRREPARFGERELAGNDRLAEVDVVKQRAAGVESQTRFAAEPAEAHRANGETGTGLVEEIEQPCEGRAGFDARDDLKVFGGEPFRAVEEAGKLARGGSADEIVQGKNAGEVMRGGGAPDGAEFAERAQLEIDGGGEWKKIAEQLCALTRGQVR